MTMLLTALLSLIQIGSTIAYHNITSLGLAALLSSYMVCIACVLGKRVRGEELLKRRFSLGAWGGLVNVVALVFLVVVFVLIFFPSHQDPILGDMNWAVLIYGGVLILSAVYFAVKGRKVYRGLVTYVRKIQ